MLLGQLALLVAQNAARYNRGLRIFQLGLTGPRTPVAAFRAAYLEPDGANPCSSPDRLLGSGCRTISEVALWLPPGGGSATESGRPLREYGPCRRS